MKFILLFMLFCHTVFFSLHSEEFKEADINNAILVTPDESSIKTLEELKDINKDKNNKHFISLIDNAKGGTPKALYDLGVCYCEGLYGQDINYKKGLEVLNSSASIGYRVSIAYLIINYKFFNAFAKNSMVYSESNLRDLLKSSGTEYEYNIKEKKYTIIKNKIENDDIAKIIEEYKKGDLCNIPNLFSPFSIFIESFDKEYYDESRSNVKWYNKTNLYKLSDAGPSLLRRLESIVSFNHDSSWLLIYFTKNTSKEALRILEYFLKENNPEHVKLYYIEEYKDANEQMYMKLDKDKLKYMTKDDNKWEMLPDTPPPYIEKGKQVDINDLNKYF